MDAYEDYQLLGRSEDHLCAGHQHPSSHCTYDSNPGLHRNTLRVAICACVVSVTMAFFNIAFLWVHPSRYSESIPYLPNEELEQPSTYIGLDTVIRGFPSPPVTITNFPFLLAQVDSSKPEHIVLDTHHWLSGMGMVYPDDRRFQVSSEISTIAQFRVMDHGMEFCRLKMVVPSLLILENASRKKTVNMSDDTIEIEVWRLNAHGRLLPSRLSWSSRPERTTLQASWRVQMGETVGTAQFPCSSGSLQTFELACGRLPCNILFQQDNKEPRLAMYMEQDQSFRT